MHDVVIYCTNFLGQASVAFTLLRSANFSRNCSRLPIAFYYTEDQKCIFLILSYIMFPFRVFSVICIVPWKILILLYFLVKTGCGTMTGQNFHLPVFFNLSPNKNY